MVYKLGDCRFQTVLARSWDDTVQVVGIAGLGLVLALIVDLILPRLKIFKISVEIGQDRPMGKMSATDGRRQLKGISMPHNQEGRSAAASRAMIGQLGYTWLSCRT